MSDATVGGEREAYGRLTEGIHITGYTFERACSNLEWLLVGDRWTKCGDFADVNAFLKSLRFDQFRPVAEMRKRIATRIKELQPAASNRQIAETIGVHHSTVDRDLGANAPKSKGSTKPSADLLNGRGANAPQPVLSGEQAARAVARAENRDVAQQEKKDRRDERERELADRTRAAAENLGTKFYNVIYADPPWRFEPYSRETGMDRAPENHYPTMTVEEIGKLPIRAADDCVVFLWATIPMLLEALDVLSDWGFDYRSQFVWVKDKIGPGYWTREQHEILLIGTKGNIPAPAPGQQFPSVIHAPRGVHSQKPEVVYEMIETMYPNLPRQEMFQRARDDNEVRPGWDVWGNEAAVPESAE